MTIIYDFVAWLGSVITFLNALAIGQESSFGLRAPIFVDETLYTLIGYLRAAVCQVTVEGDHRTGRGNKLIRVRDEICLDAGRKDTVVSDSQIYYLI